MKRNLKLNGNNLNLKSAVEKKLKKMKLVWKIRKLY